MKNPDVIIVGCGVGGLYCALNLPKTMQILIITKGKFKECDSYLAQGGICMLKDESDYDSYFEDTMKAGHYENRKESVDIMIRSSRDVISDLIGYGVDFERDENGNLAFTREGAHSTPRILYHEDVTGKEITKNLLREVQSRSNITIVEDVTMIDIIEKNGKCIGIVAMADKENYLAKVIETDKSADNEAQILGENRQGMSVFSLYAKEIVWACGGIGGLFEHSTNFPHLTADALAISLDHGISLENPDYIQIHPTTLYTQKPGRAFLISESVRGEGGILLNDKKERFVNELLPRDVVTEEIKAQMKKTGAKHVWLSMENIDEDVIKTHFRHIYKKCLEEGYDCAKECIPVVPAQHYFMGGVHVDKNSETTMPHLYAVGETSCNGVHGKNRLASNSLLESLVFAKRAAVKISIEYNEIDKEVRKPVLDFSKYEDVDKLKEDYKNKVLNEIERIRKYHEQHNNDIKCRQSDTASA